MSPKKHTRWIALAAASACALFLAVPHASQAATHKKHTVDCEVKADGKTETKKVATADECTAMGGKVVHKETKKEHKM
jgi:hypothetical protein